MPKKKKVNKVDIQEPGKPPSAKDTKAAEVKPVLVPKDAYTINTWKKKQQIQCALCGYSTLEGMGAYHKHYVAVHISIDKSEIKEGANQADLQKEAKKQREAAQAAAK